MPKKQQAVTGKKPKNIHYSQLDGFVTLYVNSVNIEASPYDLKMRLGRVVGILEDGLEIGEVAHVYMSPQHAKALLLALGNGLSRYEQTFGPIPDLRKDETK